MFRDLSVISHGAAAAVFAVLAVLVATRYLRRDIDRALFLAAIVTALWASVLEVILARTHTMFPSLMPILIAFAGHRKW